MIKRILYRFIRQYGGTTNNTSSLPFHIVEMIHRNLGVKKTNSTIQIQETLCSDIVILDCLLLQQEQPCNIETLSKTTKQKLLK